MEKETLLGARFQEAMDKKKNDITLFVWKLPKNREDNNSQETIKLVDATEEELKQFYAHCNKMLFNEDKNNPGRYNLLKKIKTQRDKCGAELFLRESTAESTNYTKYSLLEEIESILEKTPTLAETPGLRLGDIYEVSADYSNIPLALVKDACIDALGLHDSSHITKSFLFRKGVWCSKEENEMIKNFLINKEIDTTNMKRIDVIKLYLGLKDFIDLKPNSKGLSLTAFKAMLNLTPTKYSSLTTLQLQTLRNRILFDLEKEVKEHIKRWEELKEQIERVAAFKKIEL